MATVKKRGDSYTALLWLPDPSKPKGRAQRRITGRTKGEVEKECRRLLSEVDRNRYIVPSKITVAEFFPQALDIHIKTSPKGVRPQTENCYRLILSRHVLPHLGHYLVMECKPALLESWLRHRQQSGAYGKPLSKAYIRAIAKVLNACFEVAVRQEVIASNPMNSVAKPSGSVKKVRAFSSKEVERLRRAWQESRLAPLFDLLLFSGMRQGEAKFLRWSHFDPQKNQVSIEGTAYENGATRWENAPKSFNGFRRVSLTSETGLRLKEWRKAQAQERLAAGPVWQGEDYIFTDEVGRPVKGFRIKREWHRVINEAGLPDLTHLHGLRHTHATDMLRSGVQPHIVARHLGDTVKTLLETYAHAIPQDEEKAVTTYERHIAAQSV